MPIQLSAANIETLTLGGTTVETHDTAAVSSSNTDYLGSQIIATFLEGTPPNNSFSALVRGRTRSITVDLNTGNWNTSAGTRGTLSSAALTALQNNQKNLRNGLENIANAVGLIPGTVVAWT